MADGTCIPTLREPQIPTHVSQEAGGTVPIHLCRHGAQRMAPRRPRDSTARPLEMPHTRETSSPAPHFNCHTKNHAPPWLGCATACGTRLPMDILVLKMRHMALALFDYLTLRAQLWPGLRAAWSPPSSLPGAMAGLTGLIQDTFHERRARPYILRSCLCDDQIPQGAKM